MRPTARIPHAAAATEHSPLSDNGFQILGVATVSEHIAIINGAIATEHKYHGAFSIGSVAIIHDAGNATRTRVMETLQHEVDIRLNVRPHKEIRYYLTRSATEQADTLMLPPSWSGNLEAISASIALYHRATDASNLEDIINTLKGHVQGLLQKCEPNAYLRATIIEVVLEYIWNRTCNMGLKVLLDEFLQSRGWTAKLSPEDRKYFVDIIEASQQCLKTSSEEIVKELSYYHRSATKQTNAST